MGYTEQYLHYQRVHTVTRSVYPRRPRAQHDATFHFDSGNVIMKATDSKMTVNGGLNANGAVEVGQEQVGFNTTIHGVAAAGDSGLANGMIQWIAGTNKAKFVVNSTDGVHIDGGIVSRCRRRASDAYFFTGDAGESLKWDGTTKTLTLNSSTDGDTSTLTYRCHTLKKELVYQHVELDSTTIDQTETPKFVSKLVLSFLDQAR